MSPLLSAGVRTGTSLQRRDEPGRVDLVTLMLLSAASRSGHRDLALEAGSGHRVFRTQSFRPTAHSAFPLPPNSGGCLRQRPTKKPRPMDSRGHPIGHRPDQSARAHSERCADTPTAARSPDPYIRRRCRSDRGPTRHRHPVRANTDARITTLAVALPGPHHSESITAPDIRGLRHASSSREAVSRGGYPIATWAQPLPVCA